MSSHMSLSGGQDSHKVRRHGDGGAVDVPLRACVRAAKWLLALAAVVIAAETVILGHTVWGGGAAANRRLEEAVVEGPAETAPEGALPHKGETVALLGEHSASICDGTDHNVPIKNSLNTMLCAVLCGLVFCIFLDHMNNLIPQSIRFPISCIIFLSGVGLCVGMDYLTKAGEGKETGFEIFLNGRLSLAHLDPHALFFVILPPLLYESASGMQWHVLRKVLPSSIILAGPGVIVNLVLTAVACKSVLIDSTGLEFTWSQILLLSTLLSATDPVAVVAALRTLGAPPKLSSVIDGESLLNDGSAYVVFMVFQDLAGAAAPDDQKMCPGESPSVSCVIGKFFQLAAGGCAIGVASGLFMGWWIRHARFVRDSPLELAIILTGIYGTFFLAETLECSGVLAEVILGMTVAAKVKSDLSAEARHEHHMVIGIISYLSDKVIFFAAGFISARFINDEVVCDSENHIGKMVGCLFFLYFILHVVRAFVVALFAPVLRQLGYGLTFKEGCLLTFAGLRGALGLAMGLIVEHNTYIGHEACRSIAFYTSGIVFLTLVINGSTVDEFYKRLRLYKPSQYRVRHLTKQLQKIELECQHHGMRKMQRHWFFGDCDFELVRPCVPNFSTLSFSEFTVTPITTGLLSVKHMLSAVEAKCVDTKRRTTVTPPTSPPGEHRAETTQNVTAWLTEAATLAGRAGGRGDMLINVIDVDHGALEYRRLEGRTTTAGCYCSRRLLEEIVGHNAGAASFWVQLAHLGRERVVVGLSSSLFTPEYVQNPEEGPARGVLGVVPCSVGIDASNGEVWFNDGAGAQLMTDTWEALVPLVVRRSCSLTSEIIGQKSAGEVFVGYKVGSWIRLPNKSGVISVGGSESHAMEDGGGLTRQYSGRSSGGGPRGPVVKARESSKIRRALAEGDEVMVSVNRRHGQPWHVAFYTTRPVHNSRTAPEPQLVGIVSLGEFSAASLFPVVEFRPPVASVKRTMSVVAAMHVSGSMRPEVVNPKVMLSFRPEVVDVDYKESLAEVFITLFNTVLHHYNERHQHGIISTKALEWLIGCASEALDCANQEVHAKGVLDFQCVERTQALVDASENVGTAEPVVHRSGTSLSKGQGRRRASNPFQPIMVEYLFLKDKCTKVLWWENMGRCAKRFPSWDNNVVGRKMESLYAFIDCHEQVLSDFGSLERFPGVQYCLEKVINSAKADLWTLQDLSPRRFFFCRHVLLLKIVISARMRKVEEDAQEGWLASSDAEPLLEFTQDLLGKLGLHMPTVLEDEDASGGKDDAPSPPVVGQGTPPAGAAAPGQQDDEVWSMYGGSNHGDQAAEPQTDEVRV